MADAPYLSVVTTTRNDDHGGDPMRRTQIFVDALIEQCNRHRVPSELVIVEWNPPDDRPRLAEALRWPRTNDFCAVRIIEVPHDLHARLDHADRLPLFQMIGKNVGIRRARGEYVAATNIDILLSDDLMRFIAARRLRRGFFYRVDRFDIPNEIDDDAPVEEQLRWAHRNVIRINGREGTFDLRTHEFFSIIEPRSLRSHFETSRRGSRIAGSRLYRLAFGPRAPHGRVLGRLRDRPAFRRPVWARGVNLTRWWWRLSRLAVRRLWAFAYWFVAGLWPPAAVPGRVRRRLARIARAFTDSGAGVGAAAGAGGDVAVFGALSALRARLARRYTRFRRSWAWERARLPLHTNACGDFTLMSKEDWLRSGGYGEWQMYSMHIDGLLLFQAHYRGLVERFLPYPVYHIEHGGGFRPEAKGEESLYASLAQRAIPRITNEQLAQWIYDMYERREALDVNTADWGFASAELRETPIYGSTSADAAPNQSGTHAHVT